VISEDELAMLGRRVFRRMMDRWHAFQEELPIWRDSLMTAGMDARQADQFGTLLAVQDVLRADTRRYGVVDVRGVNQAVAEVFAMVEKPHPDQAPSTLAVAGRYILSPSVFERIRHQPRGAGGEIQLTDGIAALIGSEKVYAMRYQGRRYDCGSKEGFLQATIDMALANAELGPSVRQHIQSLGF
jgi:UTP--glucose-1-phosphate uridylyltransferase